MRLLRAESITSQLELVNFQPRDIPPYAIVSHTWGPADDEVSLKDVTKKRAESKPAYQKLQGACERALEDGYDWLWIDTCCIDQRSSAELSEAVNSMFKWYSDAQVCYAYLSDVGCTQGLGLGVDIDEDEEQPPDAGFDVSKWFTRGWTLQELIAPNDVVFYNGQWSRLASKTEISETLEALTGVSKDILAKETSLSSKSIAHRMSWAAPRVTTRPEDIAYSLLGIFNVNMPLLYGEGDKAFIRLQEEIMRISDDQTLFAWTDETATEDSLHGLLATSPAMFASTSHATPHHFWAADNLGYSMTNVGLSIYLPLRDLQNESFRAMLECTPDIHDETKRSKIVLRLKKIPLGNDQYARVNVCNLETSDAQPRHISRIYVRQNELDRLSAGARLWENRYLRLQSGPANWRTRAVASYPGARRALMSSSISWWNQDQTFAIPKGRNKVCLAILLANSDQRQVLIRLGAKDQADIGYDALELPIEIVGGLSFSANVIIPGAEPVEENFVPQEMGTYITLIRYVVQVSDQAVVTDQGKCHHIRVQIFKSKHAPKDEDEEAARKNEKKTLLERLKWVKGRNAKKTAAKHVEQNSETRETMQVRENGDG